MVSPVALIGQAEQSVNQVAGSGGIGRITQAIKTASAKTGVSFAYLMNKASQESSLNPNATASTSSATGLFQFTQQTWLQMVKNYGGQYGLGEYAQHIQVSNGTASVGNPQWREAILGLRRDPTVSAEMAGALDKANQTTLQNNVGGKIGPTELYLAHFLGAGGASEFLNTLKSDPSATAASILPEAAASNQSVFYNSNGQPRTVAQIYQHFAQKFDQSPALPGGTSSTMLASATPASSTTTSGAIPLTVASAAAIPASYTTSVMSSGAFNMAGIGSPAAQGGSAGSGPQDLASSASMFTTMIMAQMNAGDVTHLPSLATESASHKKSQTYAGSTSLSSAIG